MSILSGGEVKKWPTKSFIETVYDVCKQKAESIFLEDVHTNKKYTYNDLGKATNKIGATLVSLGIGPGHLVTFAGTNNFESFAFAYGVMLCGGTFSPINPDLKADEVSKMLDVSRPSMIYCADDNYLPMLKESVEMATTVKPRLMTASSFETFLVSDHEANNFKPPKIISAKHIMLVLFTSGTTGVPKAVKLRDQATLLQCDQIQWAKGRFMLTSPLYWISNTLLLAKVMSCGFTIINPGTSNAEDILRVIQDYKVTCWFGAPSVLLDMCSVENVKKYDLSKIEFVYTGGFHVTLSHKHMICDILFNGRNILRMIYGSTESGIISEWPESLDPISTEYDSIGKIFTGVKLKIQDIDNGKILGPGEKGEICVQTVTFMAGYMNKDLAGKELDENGWWHMGDIGYIDKNGYLYYVSRLKDVFKYRGVQIAPSELETVLLKHPSVLETAVVGKPHIIDGEWPTAFVVKKPNVNVTEKEIEEFVTARVPDSKKLRGGVHFLDALPRSSVGKILSANLLRLLE